MARSPTLGSASGDPGRSSMARSPTLGSALREPGALLDGALPNARKRPEGTRGAPRCRAPQRSEAPRADPGRSSIARPPPLGKALWEPGALLADAPPDARKHPRRP